MHSCMNAVIHAFAHSFTTKESKNLKESHIIRITKLGSAVWGHSLIFPSHPIIIIVMARVILIIRYIWDIPAEAVDPESVYALVVHIIY